jgi:hypothetical protein
LDEASHRSQEAPSFYRFRFHNAFFILSEDGIRFYSTAFYYGKLRTILWLSGIVASFALQSYFAARYVFSDNVREAQFGVPLSVALLIALIFLAWKDVLKKRNKIEQELSAEKMVALGAPSRLILSSRPVEWSKVLSVELDEQTGMLSLKWGHSWFPKNPIIEYDRETLPQLRAFLTRKLGNRLHLKHPK